MASVQLPEITPCGSVRPNCRALAKRGIDPRALCLLHTAWCWDDHDPRRPWAVRDMMEQRSFRTGDWH